MNARTFLGEIRKRQTELEATDNDLIRVTGWSRSTYRRRVKNPETITIGEWIELCNYLGIKYERR